MVWLSRPRRAVLYWRACARTSFRLQRAHIRYPCGYFVQQVMALHLQRNADGCGAFNSCQLFADISSLRCSAWCTF